MVEQLKFGDVEIEKKKFHSSKKIINIHEVYIEKILLSNEFAYAKNKEADLKYFIGHKTDKNRPLFIVLPEMAKFLHEFEERKHMSFLPF